jgi:hypothetical protein
VKVEHEEALQRFAKCSREHGIKVEVGPSDGVFSRESLAAADRAPKARGSSKRRAPARNCCLAEAPRANSEV